MSIEQRVTRIVVEALGVKEEEVSGDSSFVDDKVLQNTNFADYLGLEADIKGEIFNLGLSDANLTKEQLCIKIQEIIKDFKKHLEEKYEQPKT